MEKVVDVLKGAGASLDSVTVLTPGEIADAYEGILNVLAQRRHEAVARRRREAEE
ncbi:hypothetical protein ACWFRK_36890 [Streptomyces sp. NPDC055157]